MKLYSVVAFIHHTPISLIFDAAYLFLLQYGKSRSIIYEFLCTVQAWLSCWFLHYPRHMQCIQSCSTSACLYTLPLLSGWYAWHHMIPVLCSLCQIRYVYITGWQYISMADSMCIASETSKLWAYGRVQFLNLVILTGDMLPWRLLRWQIVSTFIILASCAATHGSWMFGGKYGRLCHVSQVGLYYVASWYML